MDPCVVGWVGLAPRLLSCSCGVDSLLLDLPLDGVAGVSGCFAIGLTGVAMVSGVGSGSTGPAAVNLGLALPAAAARTERCYVRAFYRPEYRVQRKAG